MNLRAPFVIGMSVIAGLFWNLGSDISAIIIHFIAPVLIATLVVVFWRALHWPHQLLLAAGFFLLAEVLRLISYGNHGGWHYITGDSETQLWLAGSFALQIAVGLMAFGTARLLLLQDASRAA